MYAAQAEPVSTEKSAARGFVRKVRVPGKQVSSQGYSPIEEPSKLDS